MPRYHVFLYILFAPGYCAHSPHGPPFFPCFCIEEILLRDQCEISYNLFLTLVPGHHIWQDLSTSFQISLCNPLSRHITVDTFLSSHILPMYSFFPPFFLHLLYFIYFILLLTTLLSSTFLSNTSLLLFTYQLKLFSSLLVHFSQLIRPLPPFFLGTYILATLLLGCNSLFIVMIFLDFLSISCSSSLFHLIVSAPCLIIDTAQAFAALYIMLEICLLFPSRICPILECPDTCYLRHQLALSLVHLSTLYRHFYATSPALAPQCHISLS